MARLRTRKFSPVSTALLAWEIWRRLPKAQRRWVLLQARQHGPRVVRHVYLTTRKK